MLDYLLDAFSGPGKAFMYAITAILALGLAILIERTYFLLFRGKARSAEAIAAIRAGEPETAANLAGPIVGSVVRTGLQEEKADHAWDAMAVEAIQVEEQIKKRIPYLSAAANIATMLGLLGTVYGLIVAFQALGDTANTNAESLSDGIAAAMSTTAFGLCVAIPCMTAHAWLEARAEALLSGMEALAAELSLQKKRNEKAD